MEYSQLRNKSQFDSNVNANRTLVIPNLLFRLQIHSVELRNYFSLCPTQLIAPLPHQHFPPWALYLITAVSIIDSCLASVSTTPRPSFHLGGGRSDSSTPLNPPPPFT